MDSRKESLEVRVYWGDWAKMVVEVEAPLLAGKAATIELSLLSCFRRFGDRGQFSVVWMTTFWEKFNLIFGKPTRIFANMLPCVVICYSSSLTFGRRIRTFDRPTVRTPITHIVFYEF